MTVESAIRYDGKLPERGSVKILSASESPLKFAIVYAIVGEGEAEPKRWKEPVHRAAANIPTVSGIADQKDKTPWQPSLGRTDLSGLYRFVSRYGPVTHFETATKIPFSEFGRYRRGDMASTDPVCFSGLQFVLRWAWHGDPTAISLIAGEKTEGLARGDTEGLFALWKFFEKKEGIGCREWALQDEDGKRVDSVTLGRPQNMERVRPYLNSPVQARVSVAATGVTIVTEDLWNFIRLSFLRDHLAGRTKICENPNCSAPYFIQTRQRQVYCSHDCAMAAASRNYRQRVRELIEREKAKGTWSKGQNK